MQKAVIFLGCLVCLLAAGSSSPAGLERKLMWLQNIRGRQSPSNWGHVEQGVHEKQKFLLDVLWQLHKPLVNAELIDCGKELIAEPAAYQEPIDDILLEFLEKSRQHAILGRHEIYTDLNSEHGAQLIGLTKFLTLAKDWPTFQRNVCFARLHWNPVLFVNALKIAVSERPDTQELIMPAMNEILPQLFYNQDVIATAENIDWNDLVTKTTSTRPSLTNVLGLGSFFGNIIGSPAHLVRMGKTGLWRTWQERRMSMIPGKFGGVAGGVGQNGNAISGHEWEQEIEQQPGNILIQSEEKIVIPVEQQTPLSYLTDDVALNTFWNDVLVERMIQTQTGSAGQQNELSMHISPRQQHSQKWQQTTPWLSGRQNEESMGHIYTAQEEQDDELPENWMTGTGGRVNAIRNGRVVLDWEDEQEDTKPIKMWGVMGQDVMAGNTMQNNEGATNMWSYMQGKTTPSGLFGKTQKNMMNEWEVSPKKHGQTGWWHRTGNMQKLGRVFENEDEENAQQGGWSSEYSQMQGQTRTNQQRTMKRQQQQQTGQNWYNAQQNRYPTEGDWMLKPTTDEETLQQHGMGTKNWMNYPEENTEAMQQLGLGTQNWKNWKNAENDYETLKQLGQMNKWSNLQQTGRQHQNSQHNLFTSENQWHSRKPRSIKTIDISPEDQLMNARSGEIFVQTIQQLAARLNLEKISWENQSPIQGSQGFSKWSAATVFGAQPQLLTTTGVQYKKWVLSPAQIERKIQQVFQKLQTMIDNTLQRSQIGQGHPDIVKIVGNILVASNAENGNIENALYNEINSAVYGVTAEDGKATPLSIPAVNLRDPVYHAILAALNGLIESYRQQVQPYAGHQLAAPGVHIRNVEVDDLLTYFDVIDADLINLVDQQLLQSNVNNLEKLQKKIVARQQHLNHKQFNIGYEIHASRPQHVVVRTFLGPKINQAGQIVSLEEARQHHILLDAFTANLGPGSNHIERNSHELTWTKRDTTTLSEIYRHVLQGLPMQQLVGSDCRFPHRLVLPRGTPEGLPMQLFVVVTPITEEDHMLQQLVQPEGLCGMGIAAMHLDQHSLNFPLDRPIENVMQFLQPNMIVKDVTIVHEDSSSQFAHI